MADENWIVNDPYLQGEEPCEGIRIIAGQGGANPDDQWYLQVNLEYSENGSGPWVTVATYYRYGQYAFDGSVYFDIDPTGNGGGGCA